MAKIEIPLSWTRRGLVLPRPDSGIGSHVMGDPCIVWDDTIPGWRMVLFAAPPGHGQAICRTADDVGPGCWEFIGPLVFTNPGDLLGGGTHKPFVVMEASWPNRAARIDGRYCLVTVSSVSGHKLVQQAWAEHLAGPWTAEPRPLIDLGDEASFDAKHVDAVSGYYFPERGELLYFYMGYPQQPQARAISPFGSAQGVAVQQVGQKQARKLGVILQPCQERGHWASGWVGGLQLLPGRRHRWVGIINASPTAPDPSDRADSREEPPPSLGGFAVCDEQFPVSGWCWQPQPIEWTNVIPADAIATGEGVNFWRQHILVLPGDRLALFYNSGPYGREQMYLKVAPSAWRIRTGEVSDGIRVCAGWDFA